MADLSVQLQQHISAAYAHATALRICGGNSKAFYGCEVQGELLSVAEHSGIVNYAPTELVLTARAGTRLTDIEQTLAENAQQLAFEPPGYADTATLGGTIACNLSGPRRAYAGAARDYMLGCKIINGKGELLAFGGEVMKNVAGYDVSRLMAGAFGTLGVLTEVSLKVVPVSAVEHTLSFDCKAQQALDSMHGWSRRTWPVTASCYDGDRLYVRLSGTDAALVAARKHMGGELLARGDEFWRRLKQQQHAFFNSDKPLWRLSVASNAAPFTLAGKQLYEWGGALRWLLSDASAETIRHTARAAHGHATLFRGRHGASFHPLDKGIHALHSKLKLAFDPARILNPGRMYADI
jgi:glycolate oxidase FAD binding subunit